MAETPATIYSDVCIGVSQNSRTLIEKQELGYVLLVLHNKTVLCDKALMSACC